MLRFCRCRRRFSIFTAEGLISFSSTLPVSFYCSALRQRLTCPVLDIVARSVVFLVFLYFVCHPIDLQRCAHRGVLRSDHVAALLQFCFLTSGYNFYVCADLVQHRFISSLILPADSQHMPVTAKAFNFSMSLALRVHDACRYSAKGHISVFSNLSLICLPRLRSFHMVVSDHSADFAAPRRLYMLQVATRLQGESKSSSPETFSDTFTHGEPM